MVKRIALLAAVAALAAPVALAAERQPAADPGAKVAHLRQKLDERFEKFASRCLVAHAPERCAHAASRVVHRLEKLQSRIDRIEARIHERCSKATPPPACTSAGAIVAQLDDLKAAAAADIGKVKAVYPNA